MSPVTSFHLLWSARRTKTRVRKGAAFGLAEPAASGRPLRRDQRQQNREPRALPYVAVQSDGTSVLFDDAAGRGQAEARATLLVAEVRLEGKVMPFGFIVDTLENFFKKIL